MKIRVTLLFIFLASIVHAQYDYYYATQPTFGLGVGYNLTSVLGDDVRPLEISFRYRINNNNMIQLLVPFVRQNDAYASQGHADMELIDTSLSTEKRLFGIGLDYDYVMRSFMKLDFVVGMRAEYQFYKYKTNLTNNYLFTGTTWGGGISGTDLRYSNKSTRNFIISPNAGLRLSLGNFDIDAKFLLSMLSTRGDTDHRIVAQEPETSSKLSVSKEWTDQISNKFKLKPAVVMSMSYFF